MSDWEDEDAVVVLPAQVPGQWDDEDVEENVLESWDQEVEETKVVEVSKKKKLKKKIQEKENIPQEAQIQETLEEQKKRIRNQELKSDLENAQDLFSGVAISQQLDSNFESSHPSSAKDFEDLKDIIIKKLSGLQGPHYINFIENLIRDISVDLSLDDSRRVVSTLNAMINEKQKALKDSKKKKSSKKGITVAKGIDTTNYDDVYDEFDDFM